MSTASVSFSVLSLASNPCNEDNVVACGAKVGFLISYMLWSCLFQECQVLCFNSSGQVTDKLRIHTSLESNEYIVKV